MFQHAVVGVDFSPATEALVACLPELRRLGTDTLTLVYVASVAYPSGSAIAHEGHYRDRLDGLAAALTEHGFDARGEVVVGYPEADLVAAAKRHDADLIVVGSRGESTLKRWFLGSTALEVVRRSLLPVLLERIEPVSDEAYAAVCERAFRRVLLATDVSAEAERATEVALELAQRSDSFAIVTVLDRPEAGDEARAREQLARVADRAGGAVQVHVRAGQAASEQITEVALSEDASLVVVGKRGQGLVHDRLLGSTAEEVVEHGRVSVLVVPAMTE